MPPPDEKERKGERGRLKRSKSRNLLKRLIKYEQDTLRFMENIEVPFTNAEAITLLFSGKFPDFFRAL